MFRKYSNRILLGTASKADDNFCIIRSAFYVFAVICLLSGTLIAINISKAGDSRILSDNYGIICPLTPDLVSLIDSFDLFHVVWASWFDAANYLLSFKRTTEVDCFRVLMEKPFM